MATEEWLDKIDFPSNQAQGNSVNPYSPWVHPQTKAVYMWNLQKNSWMLFASSGARLYSGTLDPALDGVTLYHGDLWWDSRALELRVYHRPSPIQSGQTVTGRWVSSTNPEMSLLDTDRNLVIGVIEMDAPNSNVYEEREAIFQVYRPYGGADESMINYEWIVKPNPLVVPSGSNPGEFPVIISNPDKARTSITWTEGTYRKDGENQIAFTVRCKITAKPEFEDSFVNASALSETVRVYPKPKIILPLDYATLTLDSLRLEMESGSFEVELEQSGSYIMSKPTTGTKFFLIPNDSAIAGISELVFTLEDPAEDDFDLDNATYVGSVYGASSGEINSNGNDGITSDSRPSGYTVDVESIIQANQAAVVYAFDPNDITNTNYKLALTVDPTK